ncbi:hypothetical protein GCM10009799_07080 [Nocardiopsis rhodophaea]|uniref:Uncharacterized protein n=1 Tax=Nocardiopsis rhodophaea TaxID=280238 RepID=A0ABN2SC99_9ACTN
MSGRVLDVLAKDRFHGELAAARAAYVARQRGWSVIATETRTPMFTMADAAIEIPP